jgi:hypothetical protein
LCLEEYRDEIISLKLLVYYLETVAATDQNNNVGYLSTVSGAGFGADQITFTLHW